MNTDISTIFCEVCEENLRLFESDSKRAQRPSVPFEALHSQYVPTENEITETTTIIDNEEKLLHKYDETIAHLRQAMDRLQLEVGRVQQERDALARETEARRSSISAIRRLPVELWSEIFSYSCNGAYTLTISDTLTSAPTYDLSKVCTRWNRVVIGLPHLWASIRFVFFKDAQLDPFVQNEYEGILQKYFEYSSEHPLKIELNDGDGARVDGSENWQEGTSNHSLLQTLFNQVWRCSDLSLDCDPKYLLSIDIFSSPSYPYLHSIRIETPSGLDDAGSLHQFWSVILSEAPNLASLRTSQLPRDVPITSTCPHLTTIVAEFAIFPTALLNLLSKTPALRELRVEDTLLDPEPHLLPPVTLPHLKKIDLCHFAPVGAMDTAPFPIFLDSLTLPAAEVIELRDFSRHPNPQAWMSSFWGVLRRSLCPLRCLNLQLAHAIDGPTFSSALRYCPTLSELRIQARTRAQDRADVFSSNQLLLDLIATSAGSLSSALLPKLQTLKIEEDLSALTISAVETILTLAESRAQRGGLDDIVSLTDVSLRTGIHANNFTSVLYPINPTPGLVGWRDNVTARIESLEDRGTLCEIG